MKKSTTRLLFGALIVGLLAYFFLYKRREGFKAWHRRRRRGRGGEEVETILKSNSINSYLTHVSLINTGVKCNLSTKSYILFL